MKNVMNDNKGFSLVELIVTVLITSIIAFMVMMFMSSSRSMYQTVNISASLQEETMAVERVLQEYIMEAKNCGVDDGSGTSVIAGTNTKVFWIEAKDNSTSPATKDPICFFVLDYTKKTLLFCKATEEDNQYVDRSTGTLTSYGKSIIDSQCLGNNAKYSLMAEYIEDMRIARHNSMVNVEMDFDYLGTTSTSRVTVASRNMTS